MKFVAFNRTAMGSGASRRLRNAGQTPGIVYGGENIPPQNIALDHNALYHALKKEVFHSSILDMELDGKTEKVLLRDFQVHAFKQLVLHVDFQRVDANKKIHVKVPFHFINADISPAIKLSSGIISHVLTELEVSCLPADLPEFIEIDLSNLAVDQSIHLGDLKLPEGVTPQGYAEDPTIATATIPRGAIEETPVVAPGEVATSVQAAPAATPTSASNEKTNEKK